MLWTVVLEKTLESPLDCKEIQPVNPKGNQSWIFTGRTDAEAETPILWPPDVKNWLIGKDPDAGKGWRREKGQQRMRWLDGITAQWTWVWVNSGSWQWTGRPGMLQPMGLQSQTRLSNWTELKWYSIKLPWSQSEPTLNHCSGENTRLGSRKPPVTTKNQYITFCYVCFCLKTPYWLYIVDWLTLNSGPTALHLRPEEASPTHTFSKRHLTACA